MRARDDYKVLAETASNAQLLCWTEAAAALDEIDRLRLRTRSLAHERAKIARAARRLVSACVMDDDHPGEYLEALDSMAALLGMGPDDVGATVDTRPAVGAAQDAAIDEATS